jgi:hypothetical protein
MNHSVVQDASIETDEGSLTLTSGNPIGEIWLRLDDVSFPEEGWTDFVVVVLNWWADAAADLLEGDRRPRDIDFMEGPFLVRLRSLDDSLWEVALVTRRETSQSAQILFLDGRAFARRILSTVRRILRQCEANGWITRDTELLRTRAARLTAAIPELEN